MTARAVSAFFVPAYSETRSRVYIWEMERRFRDGAY